MSGYQEQLQRMLQAMLADDAAVASDFLKARPDVGPESQLKIYRDAYRMRLQGALESAYPALAYYLGHAAFKALADGFIKKHPSRHFNLDRYAIGFAGVTQEHCDAFAAELAMLEEAVHEVYQLPESPAVDAAWAARQTPESLGSAPLHVRTASRLFAFRFPVEEYVAAFRDGKQPLSPFPKDSRMIVVRHKHQVQRLKLERVEYMLLSLLNDGMPLGAALEHAAMSEYVNGQGFAVDLQKSFARWVSEGILRQPL